MRMNYLGRIGRCFQKEKKKYVEYIIVNKFTENLGMSRKEVMQVISDIGQEKLFVQGDICVD